MNDWRTILNADISYAQNPQNPQKGPSRVNSGYFGDIRDQESSQSGPSYLPESVTPGVKISWERADGTTHSGLVDFFHTDADGTNWAFVTTSNGWAAVNIKYATKGQTHE